MKKRKLEKIVLEILSLVPLVGFQLILTGYACAMGLVYWYDKNIPVLILNFIIYICFIVMMKKFVISTYKDFSMIFGKEKTDEKNN